MAEADEPQEKRLPFVEVLPPLGTENEQPLVTNQFEVTGGGVSPLIMEFYYVSINAYRHIFRGGVSENIERPSDDRVVFRSPPLARIGLAPLLAAQLIATIYEQLHKEGDSTLMQRLDARLNDIRDQAKQEPAKQEGG
jgi:hypothetical protein